MQSYGQGRCLVSSFQRLVQDHRCPIPTICLGPLIRRKDSPTTIWTLSYPKVFFPFTCIALISLDAGPTESLRKHLHNVPIPLAFAMFSHWSEASSGKWLFHKRKNCVQLVMHDAVQPHFRVLTPLGPAHVALCIKFNLSKR